MMSHSKLFLWPLSGVIRPHQPKMVLFPGGDDFSGLRLQFPEGYFSTFKVDGDKELPQEFVAKNAI